jgi:hypothetical protein
MFGRNREDKQIEQEPEDTLPEPPKYPKPKVLLIDVSDDAETFLRTEGFNVCTGSFGKPYRVEKSSGLRPVIVNGFLPPNTAEQEVVVIDLAVNEVLDEPQGEKYAPLEEDDWWAKCTHGVIDPRSRLAIAHQEEFDRILGHGGVFVVFAGVRNSQVLKWGHNHGGRFVLVDDINYNNWSFLSILKGLEVERDLGEEISIVDALSKSSIGQLLLEYATEATFSCTVGPMWSTLRERWITVAKNKYGDPVAGFIYPEDEKSGWVFVFPQVRDKAELTVSLLREVLPEFAPHLFPHAEGRRWLEHPEYELPRVFHLKRQIQAVKEEARRRVTALEQEMESEREEKGYLYDLICETGDSLVAAVQQTLETLGFQLVVNADEELEESGETDPKREDLRINDTSPIVLVEVKGISGTPKDEDVLQVGKYIAPRMQEWKRFDIKGLSVVNHQRHLPALERDNDTLFRQDILTNAEKQKLGLLTTWDLFRLTRGYLKNGWVHEQVSPLFYRNGRIEPIPTHYEFLGVVEHFWPKANAIGIEIEKSLAMGDRIAFELPVEFEEQIVESLQIDDESVEIVEAGQPVGIKTHLTKKQLKEGIRVFRVGS